MQHIVFMCLRWLLPAFKLKTIPLFKCYTVQKKHIISYLLLMDEGKHLDCFPIMPLGDRAKVQQRLSKSASNED